MRHVSASVVIDGDENEDGTIIRPRVSRAYSTAGSRQKIIVREPGQIPRTYVRPHVVWASLMIGSSSASESAGASSAASTAR